MCKSLRTDFALLVGFFVFIVILLAGSSIYSQTNPQEIYRPAGNEGSVTGTVFFKGNPPLRKRIDMSQDANCAAVNPQARREDVIVSGGKLAHVLVYTKGGEVLDGKLKDVYFEPPSTPIVIDRQLCQFSPRVVGVQIGQALHAINSDITAHNYHPVPNRNTEWNKAQMSGGKPLEHSFKHPEILPVKCNMHPWEQAIIGVFRHPFFAVTNRDGSFNIAGLPPGTYTLAAWHETFGEKTLELTVSPYEAKNVNFEFRPITTAVK